jgi:hypothetical protein
LASGFWFLLALSSSSFYWLLVSSGYRLVVSLGFQNVWPSVASDVFLAILQDDLLRVLKQLKFFWSLPVSQLAMLMSQLAQLVKGTALAADMDACHANLCLSPIHLLTIEKLNQDVHDRYRAHLQDAMSFPPFGGEWLRPMDI